jgi:phosphomevalonate kinase
VIVSAPGKIMLLGDYAVLEGSRAMVAAVNRRAVGKISERGRSSPIVEAVLARAGKPELQIEIDTASFYDGTLKLGLGSSAAVAVVTAALATDEGDERTLELAIEGHRDANDGKGSGVDVAACFHGGVIATSRQPAEVTPLRSTLGDLSLAVLFTEKSASTKDLVGACTSCPEWPRWSRVLRELTGEGLDAWSRQDSLRFLSVVARYSRAMAGLGESAGVAIVTEELEAIARHAAEGGGAAKPSGAGGGDIAVLWSSDPELGARIAERVGVRLLDLEVDPHGLRRQASQLA